MSDRSPADDYSRRTVLKGIGVASTATLLGLSGSAMGQNGDADGPPIEWRSDYSGGDREYHLWSNHVVQTEDGGYAVGGIGTKISETGEGPEQFALVRADADGTQQSITFANDDSEETTDPTLNAMTQTADGGFALVGTVFNPSEREVDTKQGYHAMAVKISSDGAVEWVETINSFDGETEGRTDETAAKLRACAPAGDDGAFVAGGSYESDGWLLEFAADGSVEWEQTWTDDGDDEYVGASTDQMYAHEDGYLLFTSQGGEQQTVNTARYTDDGGSLQRRVELDIDYDETPYNHEFVPTDDGGYAYTGRDAGRENFVLGTLAPDGSREWREEYDGPYEGHDWAGHVVQTTDGGFALAGKMSEAYSGQDKPAIVKTDAEGTEQWRRLFNDFQATDVQDFVETDDSGYALLNRNNTLTKLAPDEVPADDGGTDTPDDGDSGTDTPDDGDSGTDTPDEGDSGTETPDDGGDATDTPDDGDSGTDTPDDGENATDTPADCQS